MAIASKATWGYAPDWMAQAAVHMLISAVYITQNPVYKALAGTELAGWYSLILCAEIACLDNLWVAPALIGQGVGQQLFEHAVEIAREGGARRLELESDPNAVDFYQRMGMRIIGEIISAMDRRLPVMAMEIQVTL